MPLSPHFIELTTKLVEDYSQKGIGTYFRKKDAHFEDLQNNLEIILTCIKDNESLLDEKTLISILAITAVRYATPDPCFFTLFTTFLSEYYPDNGSYIYLTEGVFIEINPEAKHNMNMLNDLQRAVGNLQKAHQIEKAIFNDQISCLEKERNLLKEQNTLLREQVAALEASKNQWEKLSAAGPILEKLKDNIATLDTLMNSGLVASKELVTPVKNLSEQPLPATNKTEQLPLSSVTKIITNLPPSPKPPTPPKPPIINKVNLGNGSKSKPSPGLFGSNDFLSELKRKVAEREAQIPSVPMDLEKKNLAL
ncbi:VipA [Legionella beliardensis]|uniref:VipA n=1 Tax=Legionella beliardensis TaxID=91822 RepID=A0A378HY45_9GAMM|nr:hypothetical protein [Legionella beliardensis]STX27817.1 VipA [Legionella beliardensis]